MLFCYWNFVLSFSSNFLPSFLVWCVNVVFTSLSRDLLKCFLIFKSSLLPCFPLHGKTIINFSYTIIVYIYVILICFDDDVLDLEFYLGFWQGTHLLQLILLLAVLFLYVMMLMSKKQLCLFNQRNRDSAFNKNSENTNSNVSRMIFASSTNVCK